MFRFTNQIGKRILHQALFNRPTYRFSSSNEHPNHSISLKEIVEKTKKYGMLMYSEMRRYNYYQWLGLILIGASVTYALTQSDEELYPINYFED